MKCNSCISEQPVDESTVNSKYTQRIEKIIEQNAHSSDPFLIYVGFAHTHIPLAYDPKFSNASPREGWNKVFGNTLAELDYSVDSIIKSLEANGIDKETLVIFSSDNGPWDNIAVDCDFIGSPGKYTGQWQKT